ncbi:hypothetical protein HK100_010337 [Physocladia obscura]|uniref:Uncharacterized protein n=1 Tax=Physocladia obscura TaxID=109957 RepID=A0AAD5T2F2_9FUNG|nr:hypothetical protein HK100_010337 [Physocladia obscura]
MENPLLLLWLNPDITAPDDAILVFDPKGAQSPFALPTNSNLNLNSRVVPPPSQLAEAVSRGESQNTPPSKAVQLLFGAAKDPGKVTDLTPAQIRETLFQALISLARILAPIDCGYAYNLYSRAISSKFKSINIDSLLDMKPADMIQSVATSIPQGEMGLTRLAIYGSEVLRCICYYYDLKDNLNLNQFKLAIVSGCLLAFALLKLGYFKEFNKIARYCATLSVLSSYSCTKAEMLFKFAEIVLDEGNSETDVVANEFLLEALAESILKDDRMRIEEISMCFAGGSSKSSMFVVKFCSAILSREEIWLECDAFFEIKEVNFEACIFLHKDLPFEILDPIPKLENFNPALEMIKSLKFVTEGSPNVPE